MNVVGRTRFCIHPKERVKDIEKVGGTKDVNWERCRALNPDLVIFDREENLKEMADTCPFPWIDLHITSVDNISSELQKLAEKLDNAGLVNIAARWKKITQSPHDKIPLNNIPGMMDWWQAPDTHESIIYLIWRDPWMAIGEETFIQSMLDVVGLKQARLDVGNKYPEIQLADYDPKTTTLLFSSEPFPFARQKQELSELGYACGLIDGELYSWYGLRSLAFLEDLQNQH